LQLEALESRQLLSGTGIPSLVQTPVLTMFSYNSTFVGIEKAVGTVYKTQDFSQLDATLAALSARLPYGQQVLSKWNNDQSIFNADIPGSGLAMEQKLLSDTVAYVQNGVTEGLFGVTGNGSSIFYKGNQSTDSSKCIARDPPGYGNTVYWFGYATVKNVTGSVIPQVTVAVTFTRKPTYTNTFFMSDKGTLLYIAYQTGPMTTFSFTLSINGNYIRTSSGKDPEMDLTRKSWTEFTNDLKGYATKAPQYSLVKINGKYVLKYS
jgi:hypothetical protein